MSVTFADIEAAAVRIAGHAIRTPLIESPALNDRLGRRILIKSETLQRVGAFKFRGAYNRLSQLSADEARRGVVAFSSGNHAQGVALAARLLGMPALMVTDTSFMRNPHYHLGSDTPDKLDYERMAEVIKAVYAVVTTY